MNSFFNVFLKSVAKNDISQKHHKINEKHHQPTKTKNTNNMKQPRSCKAAVKYMALQEPLLIGPILLRWSQRLRFKRYTLSHPFWKVAASVQESKDIYKIYIYQQLVKYMFRKEIKQFSNILNNFLHVKTLIICNHIENIKDVYYTYYKYIKRM